MELNFSGKRALVTGAGRGIGRAIAKKLSENGAHVIALSRSEEHLVSLKKEDPSIETVCADIRDWSATRKTIEALGHVDLLVNNAGCWTYEPFDQISEETFDSIYALHVKAPLNITQVVSNKMKEKGTGGAIVNISSGLAMKYTFGTTLYGSSKAAADHIANSMALELGPHNIRVNTVNAGLVKTEMSEGLWKNEAMLEHYKSGVPLHTVCEISDVVNAVLFLLSDNARMADGVQIILDGGYHLK